jgi:hypothetical protein
MFVHNEPLLVVFVVGHNASIFQFPLHVTQCQLCGHGSRVMYVGVRVQVSPVLGLIF